MVTAQHEKHPGNHNLLSGGKDFAVSLNMFYERPIPSIH